MHLFQNQINVLINTLTNLTDSKSYDIKRWFEPTLESRCGFAACICGHQAAAPDSEFFKYNKKQYVFDSTISSNENIINEQIAFDDNAYCIAILLEDSCIDATGNESLAESIYVPYNARRLNSAKYLNIFTDKELKHTHLNEENPTIEHAISYLHLVLTKL
jgi:hypothetical protein